MSRSCTATGRLLFTSAVPGDTVLVQTRRGALVQDRSPGLVAAAEAQMPHGLVLDGALVVRDTEAERLPFEALRRRAATRARGAAGLAARWLAHFVACDLLQHDCRALRKNSAKITFALPADTPAAEVRSSTVGLLTRVGRDTGPCSTSGMGRDR
ncbi:hypothetical protein OG444_05220 [Streptomyces sp. NBC_01232]|uniref:hypothetical protein n=1 Tax=Streptomyces sp. NBC_01232 TaxID=2903786 RepID=UPI002E155B2E|nr:hypothetical protein OG444_05220 [Streptomyces sp. NBC_01232]